MEVAVRLAASLGRQRARGHFIECAPQRLQLFRAALCRRQRRGRGLHYRAQLEQAPQQPLIGGGAEYPGDDVRIEQVPAPRLAHPGAELRPRLEQAFGGEDAHRLAISGAGDLQAFAGLDSPFSTRPGAIFPDTIRMPISRAMVPCNRSARRRSELFEVVTLLAAIGCPQSPAVWPAQW